MNIKVSAFLIAAALACACGKEKPQDEDGFKYEAVFIGDSITANWVKADRGHPETTIIQLNALIKALAEEKGYAYADYHSALADSGGGMPYNLSSDGTHPNKDAYTIMEGVIQPILENY